MGDGVRIGGGEVRGLGEAVAEAELDAELGEDVHQARRDVRGTGNDHPEVAAEELRAVHLAQAGEDVADARDDDEDRGLDHGELADGGLHVLAGEHEVPGIEAAHQAGDHAEHVAQRKQGDIAVNADDLAGLEDGVVAAAHEGAVAQDGALRGTGRAAGEEDGGRLLLVHDGDGSLLLGDAGGRKDLHPLELRGERHELLTDEDGGDVELHAGADDGHFRQGGREVHRDITGAGNGEEELDGILAVAVEDGDMGSLRKAEGLDEGAAAGDALSQFLIRNGVGKVGEGRHVGVGLLHPLHEFSDGGEIGHALQFLAGNHVIEIVGHLCRFWFNGRKDSDYPPKGQTTAPP